MMPLPKEGVLVTMEVSVFKERGDAVAYCGKLNSGRTDYCLIEGFNQWLVTETRHAKKLGIHHAIVAV